MIKAVLNGFDIYNGKEGDKLSNTLITGDKILMALLMLALTYLQTSIYSRSLSLDLFI